MRRFLSVQLAIAAVIVLGLAIVPFADAGLNTGGGSWTWSNPAVQGNGINAMSFIDANTGWAAGGGGVVLKTTDGGTNWAAQTPHASGQPIACGAGRSSGCALKGADFLDASNGFVAGDYGTIFKTTDGGADWTAQALPASYLYSDLEDIQFADANHGVAMSTGNCTLVSGNWQCDGYAFQTSDGGTTWTASNTIVGGPSGPATSLTLESFYWVNPAAGTGIAVGDTGAIYKTTDYGVSFTAVTPPAGTAGDNFYSVMFTSATNGYVVGGTPLTQQGVVLRTTDGGSTWNANSTLLPTELKSVGMSSGGTVVAVGASGSIYHGADSTSAETLAGNLAAGTAASGTNSELESVVFPAAGVTGFAGGGAGAITKTANSGGTWTMKAGGDTYQLYAASFIDASNGWAVGNSGHVLRTTDGGGTWTSDAAGLAANTSLRSVQFLSSTNGYAAGCATTGGGLACSAGTGAIYKYNSGTWSKMTIPGTPDQLFTIHMTSATAGWAAGSGGTIYRTTDGSTWTLTNSGVASNIFINSIDATDATANGWAAGQDTTNHLGVLLRYSGGAWTVTPKAGASDYFTSIDMVNSQVGYSVGYYNPGTPSGIIYKTTDGGATWNPLTSPTANLLASVAFFNGNTGFVAGERGRIFRTIDGGQTWTQESEGTDLGLNGLALTFAPTNDAYVVAGYGSIIKLSSIAGLDTIAPTVINGTPTGLQTTGAVTLGADYSDNSGGSGVNSSGVQVLLDDSPVSGCSASATHVSCPVTNFGRGTHNVHVNVPDNDGNVGTADWSFSINESSYYWTWYDQGSPGAYSNQILVANPSSAGGDAWYDLFIHGQKKGISAAGGCAGCAPGQVPPGKVASNSYPGLVDGPVDVGSLGGASIPKLAVTQRSIWGNSLEEVVGADSSKVSDHFYWTWYDEVTMADWVLVANNNSFPVYYEIHIAGNPASSGTLAAGARVTPDFPGTMGGPVEVQAWTDSGKSTPANVMASQRVLNAGGAAFNELAGIPASQLSDRYLWTWYDEASPGAADWILVANPAKNPDGSPNTVTAHVTITGAGISSVFDIAPGGQVTPDYRGRIGGPITVTAVAQGTTTPTKVIASQRVLWGPISFEEKPGLAASTSGGANLMGAAYVWPLYSETGGLANWVLVSNTESQDIYYQVKVAGQEKAYGQLPPGTSATPDFAGLSGGPVEVNACTGNYCATSGSHGGGGTPTSNYLSSQRVLYNGSFNELEGQVLN